MTSFIRTRKVRRAGHESMPEPEESIWAAFLDEYCWPKKKIIRAEVNVNRMESFLSHSSLTDAHLATHKYFLEKLHLRITRPTCCKLCGYVERGGMRWENTRIPPVSAKVIFLIQWRANAIWPKSFAGFAFFISVAWAASLSPHDLAGDFL